MEHEDCELGKSGNESKIELLGNTNGIQPTTNEKYLEGTLSFPLFQNCMVKYSE
jgi:hypothetical protein